jgi:hypothetical protein
LWGGPLAARPARTTGYTAGDYYGEQDAKLARKTGTMKKWSVLTGLMKLIDYRIYT